uniref:Uncharacterized protein n=1 Tax=Thermocrispum agreste TaxID=37925 RepID=A0A2W4IZU4_9PSEU|nr:MAG: hypothetical protein DIU77_16760 [Thermocrispum agreste]
MDQAATMAGWGDPQDDPDVHGPESAATFDTRVAERTIPVSAGALADPVDHVVGAVSARI